MAIQPDELGVDPPLGELGHHVSRATTDDESQMRALLKSISTRLTLRVIVEGVNQVVGGSEEQLAGNGEQSLGVVGIDHAGHVHHMRHVTDEEHRAQQNTGADAIGQL